MSGRLQGPGGFQWTGLEPSSPRLIGFQSRACLLPFSGSGKRAGITGRQPDIHLPPRNTPGHLTQALPAGLANFVPSRPRLSSPASQFLFLSSGAASIHLSIQLESPHLDFEASRLQPSRLSASPLSSPLTLTPTKQLIVGMQRTF